LVIIAGYYGFDNLGDEAILEELINELSSFVSKDSIVVLSHNPEKTASLYGVKSVNRWHCLTWLNLLRKAKLLVSGGGGLFQDRTGFGSVIFYGTQIILARLCGAKVLIYAQGIGPLQKVFSICLARFAFGLANKIVVRDSNSLALIASWGLKGQLTADPVWSLSPTKLPNAVSKMIETIKSPHEKQLIVGLSLRDDPKLQNYHLEVLADSLTAALPNQSIVMFLPLQAQRDRIPLQKIERLISQSNINYCWLDPDLLARPSQWLALMANFDILIGMRFHALLMTLKAGKPVIGIAYDKKVSQLLSDFEQPSLSLSTNKEQCENIWPQVINNALIARERQSDIIQNKLLATRQLADKNMQLIAEILED
jgi:polysaccharide pyruvyl transferase CsaB